MNTIFTYRCRISLKHLWSTLHKLNLLTKWHFLHNYYRTFTKYPLYSLSIQNSLFKLNTCPSIECSHFLQRRRASMEHSKAVNVQSVEDSQVGTLKRPATESCEGSSDAKRAATEVKSTEYGEEAKSNDSSLDAKTSDQPQKESDERKQKRKKVALLVIYSGKGFYGLQKCPGVRTIEEEVQRALVASGAINQDHMDNPVKMQFQRAARTDKGVSAAGQILSLKMDINDDDVLKKANDVLPPEIRLIAFKRVTRGFDSKNMCSHRTYSYVTPTFAFAPSIEFITEAYRITPEILDRVRELLSLYKGTKNFFNYTSGRKYTDASSKRYIMDMTCSEPWLQGDMEFVRITVVGQSFMLHQIRKMIGMVMAIVKGYATMENYHKSWAEERLDVPKAPGLGLMLEQVHYKGYDRRYGVDGIHEPITWNKYQTEIEEFKSKFIYKDLYETERDERSMLKWLASLPAHHLDIRKSSSPPGSETGIGRAQRAVELAEALSPPDNTKDSTVNAVKGEQQAVCSAVDEPNTTVDQSKDS